MFCCFSVASLGHTTGDTSAFRLQRGLRARFSYLIIAQPDYSRSFVNGKIHDTDNSILKQRGGNGSLSFFSRQLRRSSHSRPQGLLVCQYGVGGCKQIRAHVYMHQETHQISDSFSSLCAKVFSPAATILENEKNLGTGQPNPQSSPGSAAHAFRVLWSPYGSSWISGAPPKCIDRKGLAGLRYKSDWARYSPFTRQKPVILVGKSNSSRYSSWRKASENAGFA